MSKWSGQGHEITEAKTNKKSQANQIALNSIKIFCTLWGSWNRVERERERRERHGEKYIFQLKTITKGKYFVQNTTCDSF